MAPSTDAINVILKTLDDRIRSYKVSTRLSWALIMPAIQTISVQLYLQGRGIKGTREHLEAIIEPLQEQYGPRHQTFSDTATIEISYSQLPQFILFNVFLGAVVNKLKGAGHPPDYIASALTMSVTGIAAETMHPAVGVSLILRSCRDLQAGIYSAFVP